MSEFRGIPVDALDFFTELEANNEREWWHANKDRFEASVRQPMRAMLDLLEPAFGRFHVFRMNRDLRYTQDKSPYKTAHAAVTETEGGSSHYVQIGSTGLYVGAGIYHPAGDQLARLRHAVADDTAGAALEAAIAKVRRAGFAVTGGAEPPLASSPRGYDRDHPRIELLRWKGCVATFDVGAPTWLHTRRAAARVAARWQQTMPLVAWLDAHVGASEIPPAE